LLTWGRFIMPDLVTSVGSWISMRVASRMAGVGRTGSLAAQGAHLRQVVSRCRPAGPQHRWRARTSRRYPAGPGHALQDG